MRYVGSRLKALLNQERGRYMELAKAMCKYRRPRKNESKKEYNLIPLLGDGHNVTLSTLTGLMKETGKSIEFFVDFEPGELLQSHHEIGNHNIINSAVSNDLTATMEHLHEIIRLKDALLADKERIIAAKDSEIEHWRRRFDAQYSHIQPN